MVLFRPRCDDIIEIFGEPVRSFECDCGALMEPVDDESTAHELDSADLAGR